MSSSNDTPAEKEPDEIALEPSAASEAHAETVPIIESTSEKSGPDEGGNQKDKEGESTRSDNSTPSASPSKGTRTPSSKGSKSPGKSASSRMLQQQYQRHATGSDSGRRSSTSELAGERSPKTRFANESGAMKKKAQSMRELYGDTTGLDSANRAVAAGPAHSSASHLNYHQRKADESDGWSDSSDFDLKWRPPVSEREKQRQDSVGRLARHLQPPNKGILERIRTGDSGVATVDLTSDPEALASNIGGLNQKTMTASSYAKRSQTSTWFTQRMDGETSSISSGSGSAKSKNSRESIGSSARSRLSAPGRPRKYSRKSKSLGSTDDVFMKFISDSGMEALMIPEESETKVRAGSARVKGKKKRSINWVAVIILISFVGAAVAAVALIVPNAVSISTGEDTKSGVRISNTHKADHFRDGSMTVPSHPNKMSEIVQEVTSQDPRLSELELLIVKHGISRADDLHRNKFSDGSEGFVNLSAQTRALIWLAQDQHFASSEERDIQHRKLFQRYALAVLYYSTNRCDRTSTPAEMGHLRTEQSLRLQHTASWIHDDGWLTNSTVCEWYGVRCADEVEEDEVIVSLNLTHNGLHGTVPVHELTRTLRWHLNDFDLSGNDLTGRLGAQETALEGDESISWPRLRSVRLQDNRLTGDVPIHWLLGCPELEEINLSGNHLGGTLPDHAFEALENMHHLKLDHNNLSGKVPVLGHLRNLVQLDIQRNAFSGKFPIGVFMLTTLVELRAGDNRFTGSLSTDLANMMNLEVLSVENNLLQGHVPDVFYTIPNMTQLILRGNNFTGMLPDSFAAMEKLEALALDDNSFTGTVPSDLAGLTNLRALLLEHNNLSGDVPVEICEMKEGYFHLKKLRHIASDCLMGIGCSCCDKCY